jgi:hypothetical protein
MPIRFVDHTGRYRIIAQLQWEWRDLWVGVFWRRGESVIGGPDWTIKHLYICLVPCVPLHILWARHR